MRQTERDEDRFSQYDNMNDSEIAIQMAKEMRDFSRSFEKWLKSANGRSRTDMEISHKMGQFMSMFSGIEFSEDKAGTESPPTMPSTRGENVNTESEQREKSDPPDNGNDEENGPDSQTSEEDSGGSGEEKSQEPQTEEENSEEEK